MSDITQHRVLYLDLTNHSSEIKVHSDYSDTLGGLGLAMVLFHDLVEKQPIIISIGPLTGLFPFASSTCALYTSPLTHSVGESYVNGWWGACMKFAKLDAVVITGVSKYPVYITIAEDKVYFKDASLLWGLGTGDATNKLREMEGTPGITSIAVIGQAGEKQVCFSEVVVDEVYRFKRFGLGCQFGMRGLKGIVLSGFEEIKVADADRYQQVYSELKTAVLNEGASKLLPNFISEISLAGLNYQQECAGLPFKNLSSTRADCFLDINNFNQLFSTQLFSSFGAPLPDLLAVTSDRSCIPLDYESIVSLGFMLGITDIKHIVQLINTAHQYGLDPVSLGAALAYLTELKGISYGKVEVYQTLLDSLVSKREDWAILLSKGVMAAVSEFGGFEHTFMLNGMEAEPFHNGYATLLSQLLNPAVTLRQAEGEQIDIGLRGCEFKDEDLIDLIHSKILASYFFDSLLIDYPARSLYAEGAFVSNALRSVGLSYSPERVEKIILGLYDLKRELVAQLPLKIRDRKWSPRFFSTPSAYGMLREDRMVNLITLFQNKYL